MEDLTQIVAARLTEIFAGETQEVVARKLNSTQSNISKYVNAQQLPPADTLKEIAKAYGVSIDWVLGLSDDREIDGVVVEKLTYEQAGRIIDYLIEMGIMEVPDLNELIEISDADEFDFGDLDEEEEERPKPKPKYDSDFLKIRDRALSHILRRRLKLYEMGEDMAEMWKEHSLSVYQGVRMIKNSEALMAALDSKNWSVFKDGDWVAAIEELSKLSEEELLILVEIAKNKEKEGIENGR